MLTLKRKYYKHYTAGEIILPDGEIIKTLELPWRNNELEISCIPEKIYIVDRDHSGKMQWYRFRNSEVSPRSSIEIHPAMLLKHLLGCIAPCMNLKGGHRTSNPVAVDSIKACNLLLKWFGENSFSLEITS